MDSISINLRMNPTELIPNYYNFLADFVELIFYEDNRADETYFFEVIKSYVDRWLVNVSNIYYVIHLEIKDASLTNYCLLVMLIP